MIQSKTITVRGRELVRTWSDAGYMIRQEGTGAVYATAVDPVDSGRTYTETEEPVPDRELSAQAALDIITGVRT